VLKKGHAPFYIPQFGGCRNSLSSEAMLSLSATRRPGYDRQQSLSKQPRSESGDAFGNFRQFAYH
jgi:hypothetical protein